MSSRRFPIYIAVLGTLFLAGPSASRDGVSAAVRDWLSAFITKIDEADQARRPGVGNRVTGRVVVRVEVASDGTVKRAEVERSSGSSALDQRAIAAVRSISPFTAPPAELLAGADVTDLSFPLQLGR